MFKSSVYHAFMTDVQKVDLLKALADPTRLKLVRSLVACSSHQKSCGDLSAKVSLSQPAMSHHFGKLVSAGVVLETKHSTKKSYSLNTKLLTEIGIDINKL